ncbi:MAG: hypothetical protein NTY33_02010 [Candidatus Moranbacteria bacterium]|nr:hypothetical protein [Candidatus Moranbacteria bacterium]
MKEDMEEQKDECKCPECEARNAEHLESETMNLAILLALMPALTITFLSNAGFF